MKFRAPVNEMTPLSAVPAILVSKPWIVNVSLPSRFSFLLLLLAPLQLLLKPINHLLALLLHFFIPESHLFLQFGRSLFVVLGYLLLECAGANSWKSLHEWFDWVECFAIRFLKRVWLQFQSLLESSWNSLDLIVNVVDFSTLHATTFVHEGSLGFLGLFSAEFKCFL